MNIRTLTLIGISLCSAMIARADWQKFDDFESGKLLTSQGGLWVHAVSEVGQPPDSKYEITIDPDATGAAKGNHAVQVFVGSPFQSNHRSRLLGKIPAINYGTTGTVFFRWYSKTVIINGTEFPPDLDFSYALTAVDAMTDYAQGGPIIQLNGPVRPYNGDPNPDNPAAVLAFQTIPALDPRPDNIWVSIWNYVRNMDVANARQDHQVYYRLGENNDTPILGWPFTAGEFGGFRAKPDGDLDPANAHLDIFAMQASAGNIASPAGEDDELWLDDIYVDQTGLNLSDPRGASTTPTPQPSSGTKLVNLSNRGEVIAGSTLTVGFVISGTTAQTVLIRAAGPALAAFGVTGTLAAPVLNLFSGSTSLRTNTGWGTAVNAAEIPAASASVAAFPLAAGSADSVILMSLQPGAYTAQVTGVSGGTGTVLVEVYAVN